MSVKSVAATLAGFFSHHAADLSALDTALSGILQAIPVNAETRAHIQDAIDKVRDSAVNVENAVAGFGAAFGSDGGGDMPNVTIKRSDIDAAVADVLPAAIADYFAAHPASTAPVAPAMPDNTGLNRAVEAPTADASEETRRSEAGDTGSGNAADAGAFTGDTTL